MFLMFTPNFIIKFLLLLILLGHSILLTICFIYIFFFFLTTPYSRWDFSYPTRDQPESLALEAQSPNYWTTKEVIALCILIENSICFS